MLSRSLLLFVTLAAAVGPGLSQLSTGCFSTGVSGDCSQFIPQFCANIAKGVVSGSNTISQCFNTPAKAIKCDLTAVNTLNLTTSPNEANCNNALSTVSKNCPMGGSGMFTGLVFRFTIDPNNGTCGLPTGS
ncbi:hypothetical protein B0H19DRAFT_1259766 [Mycena capillaripes]|nr:hypothetical protein B0H19DRAFT_1259766 [Mycena capillaripes]